MRGEGGCEEVEEQGMKPFYTLFKGVYQVLGSPPPLLGQGGEGDKGQGGVEGSEGARVRRE